MKNFVLVGLAVLLCVTPCSGQSLTKVTQIFLHVTNGSDRCAWVTVYTGRLTTPWFNIKSGWLASGKRETIEAGFTNVTGVPVPAEIKVRAEFRPNGCSGSGGDPDRSNHNKGLPADKQILWKSNAYCELYGGRGSSYGVGGIRPDA